MPKVRSIVARGLLALAAIALLDIGLSLTVLRAGKLGKRPLPPFGVEFDAAQRAILERLESGDAEERVTAFDRELGWCVRPGSASASGETHINSRGMRGRREYTPLPQAGRLRLACFGDSFTFCDEVRDESAWPAILEQRTKTIEALNFGVPAYGTDQALLRMRREGVHGAKLVVLGLLLENIGRNVNRYRPLWTPRTQSPLAKPRFVLKGERLELVPQPFENAAALARAARDGSILGSLDQDEFWSGRPRLWTGRLSSIARLAAGFFAYRERDPRRLWLDESGEPRRVTLALVDSFRAEATALGARDFLVLLLPMREEFDDYLAEGRGYWSELPRLFSARGIECLDLSVALAAESNAAQSAMYVLAHLSPAGNEVVAREVRDWLVRRAHLNAADSER